jgi:hypothetical protein
VKPETVISWIRGGELAAIDVARHGACRPRFRVSADALAAFEAGRRVLEPVRIARRQRRRVHDVIKFY